MIKYVVYAGTASNDDFSAYENATKKTTFSISLSDRLYCYNNNALAIHDVPYIPHPSNSF